MDSADPNQRLSPLPSTVDEWPAHIGRYHVLGPIGAGGMGTVYKAQDPQLNRVVAVKVPRFDGPEKTQTTRRQRFQREAQSAARVRHPNVCPVYDVGGHDGQPFVVMAYIEGGSLSEHLSRKGRYENPSEAVALIRQVLDALEAIHGHGLVHRDLKPSNVMLDLSGRALVMDFGLARTVGGTDWLTSDGVIVGTLAYMAPEQAAGVSEAIGPWTDIYSVGVMLYQLLTGRLLVPQSAAARVAAIASESLLSPSKICPDPDPQLASMILKATAQEPQQRYQSAQEFNRALDGWCVTHLNSSMRPTAAPEATDGDSSAVPRRQTSRRIRPVAAAAMAVLIGAGVYILGPSTVQRWKESPGAREGSKGLPHESKEDTEARERERCERIAADALANVRRTAQAIATRAYPLAIGGVRYNKANAEGVVNDGEGYLATVKISYSNALGQVYFLEILVSYDSKGNFRSWSLGRFNDPFPPNIRGNVFDQWLD
jgi:serine/threonine protein kinase